MHYSNLINLDTMNRGVEIASVVADGLYSVILKHATLSIAVCMAVMSIVAGN